ncbi:mechanosensitive ion channel family protein [Bordetella bronchiseptica]|uniref:mechanosensitive ion channel family protein n=1 Tax=Bordetella bronchiseptica TaxID=518 RepID=UPI003F74ACB4
MPQWIAQWQIDHPWLAWAIALAVAAVVYGAATLLLRGAERRLRRAPARASSWPQALADVLARTSRPLLALAALLVGLDAAGVQMPWSGAAARLWFVVIALQVALWLDRLVAVLLGNIALRTRASAVTATLLGFLLRLAVWTLAILAMLDNLGVNVTALVASLGIGGVAVALAVQTILGDLFASISIGLDKPFEVGDFVVFGSVAGSIEHIGLKTTRIRSLGGEQIVCGNAELLKQTIQNYKRMQQRRIVFGLRLAYATSAEQAGEVPVLVRAEIERQPGVRVDRVHLARFGDNGLEYEAVYYVDSADYNRYMDIQQDINLGIMRALAARGLRFAVPERRLGGTVSWTDTAGEQSGHGAC